MTSQRRWDPLRRIGTIAVAAAALGLSAAPAVAQDREREQEREEQQRELDRLRERLKEARRQARGEAAGEEEVGQELKQVIEGWPEGPRRAVEGLVKEYGQPHELGESFVLWRDSQPFKWTVVYREPVDHQFPQPHNGYIEQYIDYRVPVDKYDDLATFNGSVLAFRTPGLLAARSDQVAQNYASLNLAHDVAKGNLSAEEARQRFAEIVRQLEAGEKPELTQQLTFTLPEGETGDPDESIIEGQAAKVAERDQEGTLPARFRGEEAQRGQRPKSADEALKNWPEEVRKTARELMGKYGEPDEVTHGILVWQSNGPWKRTVLFRDPVRHEFPKPHLDYLQQVTDYRAPVDKYDEVTDFDGSVFFDRTRGEISAMCDKEAANILALNLAHEVIEGEKRIPEARQAFADAVKEMDEGKEPELTKSLQLETEGETADPDESVR